MIQNISASLFSKQTKQERDTYLLVDVRTEEEYQEGHIPDAIHLPHDQMETRYTELNDHRDRNILLICRSGKRSLFAADVLTRQGFQNLYNLQGGMLEWTGELADD